MTSRDVPYPILSLLTVGKLFGMSPYTMKEIEGNTVLKLRIIDIITSIVISSIMLTSYAILITLDEKYEQSNAHKLQAIVTGFRIIGAVLTVTLMLQRQRDLFESLRRVHSFDWKMTTLNTSPSYVKLNLCVTLVCILMILSQLCTAFILYWFMNQSILLSICYLLSEGCQYIIIGIAVLYLDYFCFVLGRKLNFLVYLTENLTRNKKDALQVLVLISEMYGDLYIASKHMNRMVSIPVLVLTIGDILGGMTSINLIYHKQDTIVDQMYMGLYALQIICTLLPPMYLKKTPEKMAAVLAESEICYSDKKLAKAKDTLLYQTLQQNIEMTVCGLFPMSVSALSEQIGFCISFLLLLNQILEYN